MHRTRAALSVVAALLRAGQLHVFAQAIQQCSPGIDLRRHRLAIHAQGDRNRAGNLRLIRARHLLYRSSLRRSQRPCRCNDSCGTQVRQERPSAHPAQQRAIFLRIFILAVIHREHLCYRSPAASGMHFQRLHAVFDTNITPRDIQCRGCAAEDRAPDYVTSASPRVKIRAVIEMIVSQRDHVLMVSATLMLKYSFTSQKPPSLTCEKISDPAPVAIASSSGRTPGVCAAIGATIPAAVLIATVEEPVASRISAATIHAISN